MKILLSPSKTQDFSKTSSGCSQLFFEGQVNALVAELQQKTANELAELMHVSEKLAQETWETYQIWEKTPCKEAMWAYTGEVYKAFEKDLFSNEDLANLEDSVRILSGLYGILTPLTKIHPYRLEMGQRMQFEIGEEAYTNLYQYWKETLTDYVRNDLGDEELLLNLASQEFTKALDMKSFGKQAIDVDFKVRENGKLKTVSVFSKQQRGSMAAWVVKNRLESVDNLKKYKKDGFKYDESSSEEGRLVFVKEG